MIEYDPHRWWRHSLDIRGSMLRDIAVRVSVIGVWAAGVVAFDVHVRHVHMPPTLHTFIGVALGLLLVFRTNASYDRFWEGRKLWGGIVNETRNLVRQTKVYLGSRRELVDRITHLTIAFAWSTMYHLRGKQELDKAIHYFSPEEVEDLMKSTHLPLACARRITEALEMARIEGVLDSIRQVAVEHNLEQLVDYLGACERIHKTPLPFAYVIHLRRALLLYALSLPFVLVESFGWGTIAATFAISYIMFGIEEIGVEIEDPFGYDDNDLPLEQICEGIEKRLLNDV